MNRITIFLDMIPLCQETFVVFRVHGSHDFFTSFCQSFPKNKTHTHTHTHQKTPASQQSCFFPKWMGVHQLDAAGKIVELLRCSNLGINTQIICQWKNRSNFYEQMTMISPSYRSSGIETIRWSHWSFEIKSERCCRVQDSGRTGGYSSFGGSICSPVGDDNH